MMFAETSHALWRLAEHEPYLTTCARARHGRGLPPSLGGYFAHGW